MALQFPTNPADGYQVTLNGKMWRYNATTQLWTVPTISQTQSVALARTEITATAGQTVLNVTYNTSYGVDISVNGIQLLSTDYTATDGTSITMTQALAAGDQLVIMAATGTDSVSEKYFKTYNYSGTLEVATGVKRLYLQQDFTLTSVHAYIDTAPVGASVDIQINKNGTSLQTISVADGSTSGTSTGLTHSITANDYITVDITQVGTDTAGENLSLVLTFEY